MTALDLESALRNCRAALVAMTEANAAATERADRAEQRATEAETACAAMRGALEAEQAFFDEACASEDGGYWIATTKQSELRDRADDLRAAALSTPIGSGWLSPADAAEKERATIERCARAAESFAKYGTAAVDLEDDHRTKAAENIAEAIRALAPAAAHPTESES
jgi:hypothetical protein